MRRLSERAFLSVSILLLSLHLVFLYLSIQAGDIFGTQPFAVRASALSIPAFALLSAAVLLLIWRNFAAEKTVIVTLLSVLFFLVQYPLLRFFIGYTYPLLPISTALFTVVSLAVFHVPGGTGLPSLPRRMRRLRESPSAILVAVTLLVLVEEILLNSVYASVGLTLSLLALVILPLLGAVFYSGDVRRLLEVCGLVFANRVVLSSFPPSFLASPTVLPAIYTLVMIACIFYIAFREIDLTHIRLATGNTPIPVQVLVGLLTGYVLGFFEYYVLRPTPFTTQIEALVYLVVVMMVFVGTTEELLFRGLLQRTLEDIVPSWQAIGVSSLIFALMHLGWMNPLEIVFAYAAGVVFGLLCQKTNSLVAPIVAHGFGNVILYTLVLFF